MKKTSLAVTIAALLTAGINTNLWAESPSADGNTTSQYSSMPSSPNILPTDYLKKEVITSKGDSVGKIDKLVINNVDHDVYAILDVGGYLGMGGKDVAIPVNQLQLQDDKLVLSPGVTEDSLKLEKKYEKSEFSAFEVNSESSK